jgi:hypothetical protein
MLRTPQWLFVGRFAALAERSFSIPATLSNQHPTVRRKSAAKNIGTDIRNN